MSKVSIRASKLSNVELRCGIYYGDTFRDGRYNGGGNEVVEEWKTIVCAVDGKGKGTLFVQGVENLDARSRWLCGTLKSVGFSKVVEELKDISFQNHTAHEFKTIQTCHLNPKN